eukprot:3534444-Rhodomonas_salina.1
MPGTDASVWCYQEDGTGRVDGGGARGGHARSHLTAIRIRIVISEYRYPPTAIRIPLSEYRYQNTAISIPLSQPNPISIPLKYSLPLSEERCLSPPLSYALATRCPVLIQACAGTDVSGCTGAQESGERG